MVEMACGVVSCRDVAWIPLELSEGGRHGRPRGGEAPWWLSRVFDDDEDDGEEI